MLQLHPNCECCNRDLPPESPDAAICSFEGKERICKPGGCGKAA